MKHGLYIILLLCSCSCIGQYLPDFGATFTSYTEKLPFQKKNINCMQANTNEVWVGTNLGLAKVVGDEVQYINIKNNDQYSASAMYIDKSDNNWLGTRANSIITTKGAQTFSLSGDNTVSIRALHLSGKTLWAGTSKGGIYGININSGEKENIASAFKGNINDLYSEKGRLKLLARDNGLFYNPGNLEWQQFKNVKSASNILKQGDTFWVLGINHNNTHIILKSHDMIKWNDFQINCVAQNNMVFYDFDIDESGRNMWIGTNIGVLQYNFAEKVCNLFTQSHYPEFKMRAVNHISVQNDSTIWVGSNNGGLYKLTIYPLEKEKEEEDIVADATPKTSKKAEKAAKKQEKQRIKEREAAETQTAQVDPPKEKVTPPKPKKPITIRSTAATKKKSLMNFDDIKCNETLELSQLYFTPSSANFLNGQKAREYLDILVAYLKKYPDQNIELYGHTDILSNNKQYLIDLSQQRVDKVMEYLSDNGVKKRRITTIAYGGEQPIVTDKTAKNRNQNRRVEVQILCN